MKRKILGKLSSTAGESIGETLVALLISALALVMLAGAVSAGMRIVTNSKEKMEGYYQVNNAIVDRAATAPTVNGRQAQGFSQGVLNVSITNLLPSGKPIPQADYWKNDAFSGVSVIAYTESTPTPGL